MENMNITEEGVDRISELSDEVLGRILSFLLSEEAIATCSLSKRWRYIWKIVPALDLVCLPDMTIKANTKVSEFMRLCGTKRITRFHVKCKKSHGYQCWRQLKTGPCCLDHIQEFVDAAIAVKVEQLSISTSRCRSHVPVVVPTNLFNCATIVTLKLEGPFILAVPFCIQLPSMKSLHLNVQKCEPSCEKFLSGSPSLEEFYLKEGGDDLKIVPTKLFNCATIVTLKLEGPFILAVPFCIQLPSMKSLHLNVQKCEPSCEKFLSGSPSLEEFYLKGGGGGGDDLKIVPTNLFNCATIVTLKLEGPFILLIPSCIQLPSLKSLHLNVRKCEPSCKKLLSGSPALQVFYLNEIDNLWFKEFKIERNSQGNLIVSNNSQNHHEYDYVYMTLHKVDDHSHVLSMLHAIQNVEFLCDWKEEMEVNRHSSIDSLQFPNLVHLELHLRNNVVSLPIDLFTCTTIVTLKIKGSFALSVPSCIQLPSLKRLHLNLRNCEPASCKAILSGSPALELFHLKHEWRDGFEDLIIERNSGANLIFSKNQLINLVIQSDGGYDCFQDYFEGHLENIVKAKVFMTLNPEDNWSRSYIREVYAHAFSILKAIRNVEFLSLCDKNYSIECDSSVDLPKLPNLVQLQLHIRNQYSSLFLKLGSSEYCPKLEEFGVNNMHWKYCKQQTKWINMTTPMMHPDHYGHLSRTLSSAAIL